MINPELLGFGSGAVNTGNHTTSNLEISGCYPHIHNQTEALRAFEPSALASNLAKAGRTYTPVMSLRDKHPERTLAPICSAPRRAVVGPRFFAPESEFYLDC